MLELLQRNDPFRLDGAEVKPEAGGVKVLVSSFRSNVVRIRVQKKPGMENADLLADAGEPDQADSGIWGRISDSITK